MAAVAKFEIARVDISLVKACCYEKSTLVEEADVSAFEASVESGVHLEAPVGEVLGPGGPLVAGYSKLTGAFLVCCS